MCGEQWHGPGVGVIPELARVAREQLTELGIRQGRRRARATGSLAISQRGWRSFGKIMLNPAIDRAAFHTRMLGNDGNRLTFCNRQPPEGADKVWRRALAQALATGVDAPSN